MPEIGRDEVEIDKNSCFTMLREMELIDEDDDEEGIQVREDDLNDLVEESTIDLLQDATVFPPLMDVMAKNKSKWGPLQDTRTSSRIGDSNIPITMRARK